MPVPPAPQPRCAVIVNPSAGSKQEGVDLTAAIREALPDAEIRIGLAAGDAETDAAAARREGCNLLIAAGGDGTLHEVINGCMSMPGPVSIGLLPLGTGNDFARALALPFDLPEALAVIRAGHRRLLDLVRVSGDRERWMINVSAGGFAGVVDEKITPEVKAAWGPLSYLRGMIEAFGEMETYQTSIRIDDQAPLEMPLLNVVVANAGYVARGVPIAPAADPGDGLIDLVAIRDVPAARLALLAPRILSGSHLGHEDVLHVRGRRIAIESIPPMIFNADGEKFGQGAVTFEVVPSAISFIVPIPNSE